MKKMIIAILIALGILLYLQLSLINENKGLVSQIIELEEKLNKNQGDTERGIKENQDDICEIVKELDLPNTPGYKSFKNCPSNIQWGMLE